MNFLITRVSERHWHALEDDVVVGRGEASERPDGRTFLSIDVWREPDFDRLARQMLAALPRPLYTVVDEADAVLTSQWRQAGLQVRRREWELAVPTDPALTGLATTRPPAGVTVLGVGEAAEAPLRELDEAVRAEVGGSIGWQQMPAEVLPRLDGDRLRAPSRYAAAATGDRYVGLLRLAPLPRLPRIGLVAVRADHRRRGVARALLAQVLGALHERGVDAATAEVHEANAAALALFEGLGASRSGSNLELVAQG